MVGPLQPSVFDRKDFSCLKTLCICTQFKDKIASQGLPNIPCIIDFPQWPFGVVFSDTCQPFLRFIDNVAAVAFVLEVFGLGEA